MASINACKLPPPSSTLTVNAHFPVKPVASVARQVTVVVPIGNRLPLAGSHVTAGEAGPQASVAEGLA